MAPRGILPREPMRNGSMSTLRLSGDSILERHRDVRFARLPDDRIALLSLENNSYYDLGSTGSEIWRILSKGTTVHDLVTALVERFEVSREDCETQLRDFVGRLLDEGLVVVRHA